MLEHRTAYLQHVERLARRLCGSQFRRFWTVPTLPGEWWGKFEVNQNLAFLFAVLYHFSGDTAWLARARRHLLDFDRGYHFTSLFCGKAYELIEAQLSADERQDFARRWIDGVDPMLDKFVRTRWDGLRRFEHVNNHALCACCYADYAGHLFPAETKGRHFEKTTDRVWKLWWDRREFQEQAPNYEGFSYCYHCHWAGLRGVQREFYRTPSIRNIFERARRIVSPAGIVSAYGDCGHNEHATEYVALFEKVGRELQDGEYKQTAFDIFAALKRIGFTPANPTPHQALEMELCTGRMVFGRFAYVTAWLALAALWSDPRLKPRPRTGFAGLNRRLPLRYRLKPADRQRLPDGKMENCQVALTGGGTYLLVSVGKGLLHDHSDAGAILTLICGTTCLLGTCGYVQKALFYHHLFYAQPGRWANYPEDRPGRALMGYVHCRAVLEDLQLRERTSYCRLRFKQYHRLPLSFTREIAVAGDGAVTLLDRVVAHQPGWCGGPVFHAEKIRKLAGRNYLLRNDRLRSMCGTELKNSPGELLVQQVYPDTAGGVKTCGLPETYRTLHKEFPLCRYRRIWKQSYTMRQCLYARCAFDPGQETLFVTRLVPAV